MKLTVRQLAGLQMAIRHISTQIAGKANDSKETSLVIDTLIDKGIPTGLEESCIQDNADKIGAMEYTAILVELVSKLSELTRLAQQAKAAAEEESIATPPPAVSVKFLPVEPEGALKSVMKSMATELAVVPDQDEDEVERAERLVREAKAKRKAAEDTAKLQADQIRMLTGHVKELSETVKVLSKQTDAAQMEAKYAKTEAAQAKTELAARPAAASVTVDDKAIQAAVDARLSKTLRDSLGSSIMLPTETPTVYELRAVGVPEIDDGYLLDEAKEKLFHAAWAKAQAHTAENIILTGPTGCGKTSAIEQFCARNKIPLLMMSCQNMREVRDWFGFKTISGGSMGWNRSQFEMAVSAGTVVIVMDELNRTTPYVANGLMGLLDHRRAVLIEEIGEVIKVGRGTLFVGTVNEGGAYTGTHSMDLASRGRFGLRMECDYLPEEQEVDVLIKKSGIKRNQATRLVEFAHAVRQKASSLDGAGLTGTVSTRQLLTAAEYLARGGTATLEFTIVNHFDGTGGVQSERAQVVAMLEGKFPELKGKPAEAEAEPAEATTSPVTI